MNDFVVMEQAVDVHPAGRVYMGMTGDDPFLQDQDSTGIFEQILFHWRDTTGDSVILARSAYNTGRPEVRLMFPIVRRQGDGTVIADVSTLFSLRWRTAPPAITLAPDRLDVEVVEQLTDQRVTWHWSIALLPAVPMRPRVMTAYDASLISVLASSAHSPVSSRTASQNPSPATPSSDCRYLARWRLEKKVPGAALSDVVHPIVYDIDPNTPAQWLPWVKQGVEEWLPAFEAMGFRHAIVAHEIPQGARLPDATHTLLLWARPEDGREYDLASPDQTPGITLITADPRTGEILRAKIQIHEVAIPTAWRTFVDPSNAMSDSGAGQLLKAMIAHEVGHSLGLQHQFGLHSIMSYTFFQRQQRPEDHVPYVDRFTHVTAVDRKAITLLYGPDSTQALGRDGRNSCP